MGNEKLKPSKLHVAQDGCVQKLIITSYGGWCAELVHGSQTTWLWDRLDSDLVWLNHKGVARLALCPTDRFTWWLQCADGKKEVGARRMVKTRPLYV